MKAMGIQFQLENTDVLFDINFLDKLNLIKGSSGTGKTFLFNVIQAYCITEGISCAFIDSKVLSNGNKDIIYSMCLDKEIIILDNADLYLDSELFDKIRKLNCTVIISKKVTFGLNMENVHLYLVNYERNVLNTKRWQ